ncbi:EAL domain-containing protein [Roseibium algae]|uniref:EAL domain-containing protein n=1 Tax=Roseibium algae TaxID=3123038 RepID=A0ABU8TJ51_9HYPH
MFFQKQDALNNSHIGMRVLNASERISQISFLVAIQRSLALAFPLLMLGAIAFLLRHPPFNAPDFFYGKVFLEACDMVISATFGVATLVTLIGFSFTLTNLYIEKYGQRHANPAVTTSVVLSCFFVIHAPTDSNLMQTYLSMNNGFLAAIITASVSASLFLKLSASKKLRLQLGELDTDPLIGDVLKVLPAAILTIILFVLVKASFVFLFNPYVFAPIEAVVISAFAGYDDGLELPLFYTLLVQVFWFFGIHGTNTLTTFHDAVFFPAMQINFESVMNGTEPRLIFTSQFFDFFARIGGAGSTLCLIFALLIFGRSLSVKKFAILALIPGIFNINEPLLIGIPLILNPLYAIPFIFTPILQTLFAYAAIALDYMPKITGFISWTTPVFFSGYLSTGSYSGAVVQALSLAFGTAFYAPFVFLSERVAKQHSKKLLSDLQNFTEAPSPPAHFSRYQRLSRQERRLLAALADDLETALKNNTGLFLEYQPQVDASKWAVCGVEALLRWEHPTYGRVAPPLIVALSEELGELDNLGLFVLNEACRQRAEWDGDLTEDFKLSVNVSPHQLRNPDFGASVHSILHKHGLEPRNLELEITESNALLPEKRSVEALKDLRRSGVKIALDDFGMGHTSLHYIQELPLNTIKIDRSLTLAAKTNANEVIVKSILELGNSLGISIVVEGIEDEKQLEKFMSLGCVVFQGYLFSKPLPASVFPSFAKSLAARPSENQTGAKQSEPA